MLRLTDLKLPLGHDAGAIRAALLKRLRIPDRDLVGFSVFRRSTDARKKSAIVLTYTLDVEVADEARLLERFAKDRNLTRAPDMSYRFVARAPARRDASGGDRRRPVRPVRRADAGADGLPSDHPRARQGRARAHQGHLGPVAPRRARPGIQRAVRRGRRRHRSPTASSTARSRIPTITAARC